MSFLRLVNIRKAGLKEGMLKHSNSAEIANFSMKEPVRVLSWAEAKDKHFEYVSANKERTWSEMPEWILLDFVSAGQHEWFKTVEGAVKFLACNWVNTLSLGRNVEIELPDSFGRAYFFKLKALDDSMVGELTPEDVKTFADEDEEMTLEIMMEISDENAKKKGIASGGGLYQLKIAVSEDKFIEDINRYNNDIEMAGRYWVNELDFSKLKVPLIEKDILKPVVEWSVVAAQVERMFERDGRYIPSDFSVITTLSALSCLVNDLMKKQTLEISAVVNQLFEKGMPVLVGKSVLVECLNSKLFLNEFK